MNLNVKSVLLIFIYISFSVEEPIMELTGNSSNDCNVALQNFAVNTAHFTLCAIMHARPIKLCELCATNYTNVQDAYDKILKLEDDSGAPCKKRLINVDRLEILENGHSYVQNLWQNGNCERCFEIVNGTMTDVLRNETRDFLTIYKQVNTCFSDRFKNGSYNGSVCKDCSHFYNDMNDFYEGLKTTEGDICVDIVDSVNTTRAKWSEILRCDRKEMHLEVNLVVALIVVSLLPLAFYASTKHLTSQVTRLSQQKRLVQTFPVQSPSTSR